MNVQVLLFAAARDRLGRESLDIELPETARVHDLKRALSAQYPELEPLLPICSIAVDHRYAADDEPLASSTEIALIPPVSGG